MEVLDVLLELWRRTGFLSAEVAEKFSACSLCVTCVLLGLSKRSVSARPDPARKFRKILGRPGIVSKQYRYCSPVLRTKPPPLQQLHLLRLLPSTDSSNRSPPSALLSDATRATQPRHPSHESSITARLAAVRRSTSDHDLGLSSSNQARQPPPFPRPLNSSSLRPSAAPLSSSSCCPHSELYRMYARELSSPVARSRCCRKPPPQLHLAASCLDLQALLAPPSPVELVAVTSSLD